MYLRRWIILLLAVALTVTRFDAFSQDKSNKEPWITMHLLGFNTDSDLEKLAADIPKYASKGLNILFLEVDYNFDFESHPELRSDKFITKAGAYKLATICKKSGIRIVPEFQCLGHQSWAETTFPLLTKHPELDLTPGAFPENKGLYCREWDPTNPKVNQIILPMIDEIIAAFGADGIHVGMDEVFLLGSEKSPATKGRNPAELYAKTVNELHDHFVKKKGLQMFMWGDRLIDGSKTGYGAWEGSTNGTFPAVDLIPRDIVICDWHYRPMQAYPSIPMFLEKGFKVLPCSFTDALASKTLIRYSLLQDHPNMMGHMFTSWSAVSKDSLLLYPAFTEGIALLKEPKIWTVTILPEKANADGTINVILKSSKKDLNIYYTTDGSEPGLKSSLYTQPLTVNKSMTVKAVAFMKDKPAGETASRSFLVHQAVGKDVKLVSEPDYRPSTGSYALVNGVAGSDVYSDGEWLGFEGKNVEVIIALGSARDISEVSLQCLLDPQNWIYPGERAEVWISGDGNKYNKAGESRIQVQGENHLVPVKVSFPKASIRYLKLVIPGRMIPKNAKQGAGSPASIFIDEIVVK